MRFGRTFTAAVALSVGLAVVGATGLVAPATATPVGSTRPFASLSTFTSQTLKWTSCPGQPGVTCTWLRVPVDYSKPSGTTIKVRVALHKARVQKGKLGYLFTNPGGPGAAGTDVAYYATAYLPPAVSDHYDVVGIDPRGVGQSAPIRCLTNAQQDALNGFGTNPLNATPTTASDIATWDTAATAFGADCAAKNATMISHVGTLDAARDMDVLRAALHQSKITYYGWSYGTYLGAWYAQLFPTHTKRVVLDGAIDPSLDNATLALGQLAAFENALKRFLANCPKHKDCPTKLSGTATQNYATFQTLSAQLATTPDANTGTNQPLTQELLLTAVIGALYDDEFGWAQLRQALSDLMGPNHDGGLALLLAYQNDDHNFPGSGYTSNLAQAFNAISCYDYKAPPNVANASNEIAATWTAKYPVFGATFAWAQQFCAFWPVHTTRAAVPLHAKGSGPILVVGTKYDPATPYSMAVALSKQLQHGRLLTWIGDGHTAYYRGSSCIDASITKFLTKGTLPPIGRVCAAVTRP